MKQILEELFPFAFCYFRSKRIVEKAADPDIGKIDGEYSLYHQLDSESLSKRLKEEHERGRSIDDKTIKFTVSLSIALTILGSVGGYFSKTLGSGTLKLLVSSASGVSVLYTIAGGILALGALKTLPTYGYGTNFDIKSKNDDNVKVTALAAQEKVNTARHLRNEAAYQCLRNGFLILWVSLVLFFSAPFLGTLCQKTQMSDAVPTDQDSEEAVMMPSNKSMESGAKSGEPD